MPEERNLPQTLQTDILSRIFSETELDKIIADYRASRKSLSTPRRIDRLTPAITEREMECLKFYVEDTDVSVSEFARKLGVKPSAITTLAQRAGLKFIFQNQEKLDL